jgi:uncharacterized membrane protein
MSLVSEMASDFRTKVSKASSVDRVRIVIGAVLTAIAMAFLCAASWAAGTENNPADS